MLDIKFIRDNVDLVEDAIKNKNETVNLDLVLTLDKEKRKIQFEYDTLRSEQNKISQQIPKLKKKNKDVSKVIDNLKNYSSKVKILASKLAEVEEQLEKELLKIPNLPNSDVPIGQNESDNKFLRDWGDKRKFGFQPKKHLKICKEQKLLDIKRAAKISGSGFVGFQHKGAKLARALINFMLDYHIEKHNYKEISLPVIVNRKTMTGTGQLPKLADDMYHIEKDDLFLVPTSEVSVTNLYSGEILGLEDLPQKFISNSLCFRREAGSHGKETKGLQRVHQFSKVEMVKFVTPDTSYEVLDDLLNDAEDILQALELPYRIISLATGDLSFASAKTYDLEVWAPATERYLEVSSVSNFEDFQARRASIRYRDVNGNVQFVHTLNGSGLAIPRTFIAILETYQNEDGTITIPKVLRPYFNNEKIL